MTARQPPLAIRPLEGNPICDVCGKPRSTRKHSKCSKARQKMHAWKWQENDENENPLPLP